MDEIDYKQAAQNIIKLVDAHTDNKSIECYIKWILGKKQGRNLYNYERLCTVLKFLDGEVPTVKQWKFE
jgi:hypothetical protein